MSFLPCLHLRRRYFQIIIFGCLRGTGGLAPAGTPTMIGAMAVILAGIFKADFHSGAFGAETANPMTQVPSPFAQAASIRFSAASQQSTTTNGPCNLLEITISVPAL